jgi:AdoMet-dependent rRNA methyltransferase SPB1
MVQNKGKHDYFYFYAKQKNFRSRAAFKLIQLNNKFEFLNKSKGIIDLCSAPGSWLQVCKKICPKGSLIIGIDAEKIKPILGCQIIKGDITSPNCIRMIKEIKKLNKEKIWVILHDGAPKMGVEKFRDVFNQNLLVLKAFRLSHECLEKKGWFVTKIFRSKFINGLLYTLQHFYFKIFIVKPLSSRNKSSEIFIVCKYFNCPKKSDQCFFLSSFVFGLSEIKNLKSINSKKNHLINFKEKINKNLEKIFRFKGFLKKLKIKKTSLSTELESIFGINYYSLILKTNKYFFKIIIKKKLFLFHISYWFKNLLFITRD